MAQVILESSRRLIFPPAPLFAAHFPGAPRVPGSCLVEALRRALEEALPAWRVRELAGARFRRFVAPEEELEATLHVVAGDTDAAEARCALLRQGVRCADVRFLLRRR